MHKGAVCDGIQSTSRIYYKENVRDLGVLAKEKKMLAEEKSYLKSTHFKFSMRTNNDQWKSTNSI
jgi:hypothetical protein